MRPSVFCGASLLLLLTASTNPQQKQDTRHSPIAFVHVAVVDTNTASVLPDVTVVITGDHIASVDKAAAAKVPKDAQVVDARGKFLIPGLWDMHVHTFRHNPRSTNTWYFPLFIANGVTGVRDMWTTGEDFVQVVQFRRGLADGSFLGPRYGAVAWMVDGPDPIFPNSYVVKTPEEARGFVDKAKASGVEFVKVYQKLPREEYLAIVDEAKKVGIPFVAHMPWAISAAEASDDGARSIEHLSNVMEGCSTIENEFLTLSPLGPHMREKMFDTYDQHKCEQLKEKFARNQTWQVPTSWMFFEGRALLQDHLATDARSTYLPKDVRASWQEQPAINDHSPSRQQVRRKDQNERLAIIAMMNKKAVPMMAGTDLGNSFVLPGFNLHDELAIFVQAGLTPGEALKTATYNPAKFLGMLDRLGTVEKGKLADLVLLDANPLEDIHNTERIRAVVLNGRYLDRSTLDKMLRDAEEAARAAPQEKP